jgi:hypothetical protein
VQGKRVDAFLFKERALVLRQKLYGASHRVVTECAKDLTLQYSVVAMDLVRAGPRRCCAPHCIVNTRLRSMLVAAYAACCAARVRHVGVLVAGWCPSSPADAAGVWVALRCAVSSRVCVHMWCTVW